MVHSSYDESLLNLFNFLKQKMLCGVNYWDVFSHVECFCMIPEKEFKIINNQENFKQILLSLYLSLQL